MVACWVSYFEELYKVIPPSTDQNTTIPLALVTNQPVSCDLLSEEEVHTAENQLKVGREPTFGVSIKR